MTNPSYLILYVNNIQQSVELYQQLLNQKVIEQSEAFALFLLESGSRLGLWRKETVVPKANVAGGSELAFELPTLDAVDQCLAAWQDLGLVILQFPQTMDFGYTFTAQDPDGHRLRVFVRDES